MRWEDERYVRVYTRDTAEWVALGWEAQCLFMAILRKVDRAGILTLGKTGVRGLAGLVGAPIDLVERSLPVLLDDGCVKRTDTGLVLPNFIAAQDTPLSDKARQREKRERDRTRAMAEGDITKREPASRNVTETHAESRDITPDHAESLRAVPNRAVPASHTQEAAPLDSPDAVKPASPTLGALRSHRVILDAALGAPLGADIAIAGLAEAVDGTSLAKCTPWPWVEQAIADAARDLGAEASGVGRLNWTTVATKVARYTSNAKAPRDPAAAPPRASGAPSVPMGEDERWAASAWQQARAARGLPDGDPDSKHVAALWAKAAKQSMGAKPVAGWKPGPRDIVTHSIRTYLDTPQIRAGGDADQGYPLAFLVHRMGESIGLPTKADVQRANAPTQQASFSREDFAPVPPALPLPADVRDAFKNFGGADLGGTTARSTRPGEERS